MSMAAQTSADRKTLDKEAADGKTLFAEQRLITDGVMPYTGEKPISAAISATLRKLRSTIPPPPPDQFSKYTVRYAPGARLSLGDLAQVVMGDDGEIRVGRWGSCQYTSGQIVYDMLSHLRAEQPKLDLPGVLELLGLDWKLGRQREAKSVMIQLQSALISQPPYGDEAEAAAEEQKIAALQTVDSVFKYRRNHEGDLWGAAPQVFYAVFPGAPTLPEDGYGPKPQKQPYGVERKYTSSSVAGLLAWILRDVGIISSDRPLRDFCT